MNQTDHNQHDIIEICLLAGRIMLQSGAETSRIEDTMRRIAASLGFPNTHSFVMPTGIIFSLNQSESTKLIRISNRSTDLQKVTMVNSVSRRIDSGELAPKEALELLKEIDRRGHAYSIFTQVLAAAIVSGCFLIMLKGQWNDFVPAMITGGIGYLSFVYLNRLIEIRFFSEFLSSFILGSLAVLLVITGMGEQLDKIIIGSVMPLVPGLLITNAVRDLMAGHLLSGLSKVAEAILTAFAIGVGIVIALLFI